MNKLIEPEQKKIKMKSKEKKRNLFFRMHSRFGWSLSMCVIFSLILNFLWKYF